MATIALTLVLAGCASDAIARLGPGADASPTPIDVVVPSNDTAPTDGLLSEGAAEQGPPPPRLLSPLSTSYTTSRRPTLRWQPISGNPAVQLQICRDRACTQVELELRGREGALRPEIELSPGVHFWRAFSIDGSGVAGRRSSATWEFMAPQVSRPSDLSSGSYLDVNGDGLADIVYVTYDQLIKVFFGRRSGQPERPDQVFHGASPVLLGTAGSVGDVDGDGFGDLAVSSSGPDSLLPDALVHYTGQLEMFYGSSDGLQRRGEVVHGRVEGFYLGFGRISAAGDLNGDGFSDFISGSMPPFGGAFPKLPSSVGRYAATYLGGPSGIRENTINRLMRPATASDFFGSEVVGLGDFTGDSLPDLYVSENVDGIPPTPRNFGRAYIYRGTATGFEDQAAITLTAGRGLRTAGTSTWSRPAPCDVNGDGRNDLVLNVIESDRTSLGVFLGSTTIGVRGPDWTVSVPGGTSNAAQFITTTCGGDLNGDVFDDVIAYRSNDDHGLWLMTGGDQADRLTWSRIPIDGVTHSQFAINSFSVGGDFDGDSWIDLHVSWNHILDDMPVMSLVSGSRILLGHSTTLLVGRDVNSVQFVEF